MGRFFGAVRRWRALTVTLLAMSFAAGAGATCAGAAEKPNVVVTIKPVHALVLGIMEGVGTPALLVEGAASPHTFSLRPSQARAINAADVFIRVSADLEPFTRRIVPSLPATVEVITLAEAPGVEVLPRRSGATFAPLENKDHDEAGHAHDHEAHGAHDHGPDDGHIWIDPRNAKAIVTSVTAALAARYPESAGRLRANAAALATRIDALSGEIERDLAPVKGKPFVVFHDSTQYFERRFGLAALGAITVSADVQPSARRLTEIRREISNLGAVCVFSEPGFQPRLLQAVTEGTAARTGTLDVEGQALQPGPDLYFLLMRGLAQSFAKCLGPADR